MEMDAFVASVRESLAPPEETETIESALDAVADISNTVKERALHYLEQVGGPNG